jgi:hypothetical protein
MHRCARRSKQAFITSACIEFRTTQLPSHSDLIASGPHTSTKNHLSHFQKSLGIHTSPENLKPDSMSSIVLELETAQPYDLYDVFLKAQKEKKHQFTSSKLWKRLCKASKVETTPCSSRPPFFDRGEEEIHPSFLILLLVCLSKPNPASISSARLEFETAHSIHV